MRVLIIDDVVVVRHLLRTLLEERGHDVIEAGSGLKALEMLAKYQPDIITMDVHMPVMDGIETTREIMKRHPLPIVVVTGSADANDSIVAMRALGAGALAVLEKPTAPWDPRHEVLNETLLHAIEHYATVRVHAIKEVRTVRFRAVVPESVNIIAIGASAGGPAALQSLLQEINAPLPVPIIVVQHISPGFLDGFADWLTSFSRCPVSIAKSGEKPEAGHLYLAPDHTQLTLNGAGRFALNECTATDSFCPSVNTLFHSVARHFGHRAIGIVLSGMGKDGADGAQAITQAGGRILIQSPDTAVVDSMPKKTMEAVPHADVLPPKQIASFLTRCLITHAVNG